MAEDPWERVVRQREDGCTACETRFRPGDEVVTSLELGAEGFVRQDLCPACFEALEAEPFSFWRAIRAKGARPGARRLDLNYLTEFFRRLDGREDEHSRRVAWLVGLLLMRKRILVQVGRRVEDDREVLEVSYKNDDHVIAITDPGLSPEDMASLHEDLARIFNLEDGEVAAK